MQFGILTTNFDAFGDTNALTALAADAENSGWHGFFLWDHIQFPDMEPCVDPWMALAAIAVTTQKLRLGTLVTPLPRRRISTLARQVLTLDAVSKGRAILGVGMGFPVLPEFKDFGDEADLRTRGNMLDEGLKLLSELISGQPVNFSGKHYQIRTPGFSPSIQKPRVPIWVAGGWPGTRPFRRAAKWDGVVPMSSGAMEGKRITTDELENLIEYIGEHREGSERFDVVQLNTFSNSVSQSELAEFAEAGVTWWIESAMPGDTVEDLRARILAGPPIL